MLALNAAWPAASSAGVVAFAVNAPWALTDGVKVREKVNVYAPIIIEQSQRGWYILACGAAVRARRLTEKGKNDGYKGIAKNPFHNESKCQQNTSKDIWYAALSSPCQFISRNITDSNLHKRSATSTRTTPAHQVAPKTARDDDKTHQTTIKIIISFLFVFAGWIFQLTLVLGCPGFCEVDLSP